MKTKNIKGNIMIVLGGIAMAVASWLAFSLLTVAF